MTEKFHRRILAGYRPWGRRELDTTKQPSMCTHAGVRAHTHTRARAHPHVLHADHGDDFICQDPTAYSGALYVNYTSIKLTKINVLNSPLWCRLSFFLKKKKVNHHNFNHYHSGLACHSFVPFDRIFTATQPWQVWFKRLRFQGHPCPQISLWGLPGWIGYLHRFQFSHL